MQEDLTLEEWLTQRGQIVERPFTSTIPVIGSLITRFREAWNSVSTKWYVRPLLQQQNHYNQLVARQISVLDQRLVAQDQDQVEIIRQLGEIATQLAQVNRLLTTINHRLDELDQTHPPQ